MKEVSNSTIALLVVLTIVVSVFGTMLSITRLSEVGITGMLSNNATAVGAANLTVPASAFINLSDSLVELGSINPDFTNTSDDKDDWFFVRNDGSVNVSIDIYDASQYTATAGSGPFSSLSTGIGCLGQNPRTCFMVKCNSTQSGYSCNNSYYAMPVSSGTNFIVDLSNVDSQDEAVFGINVTVPQGEEAGNKQTNNIIFLAASSN